MPIFEYEVSDRTRGAKVARVTKAIDFKTPDRHPGCIFILRDVAARFIIDEESKAVASSAPSSD